MHRAFEAALESSPLVLERKILAIYETAIPRYYSLLPENNIQLFIGRFCRRRRTHVVLDEVRSLSPFRFSILPTRINVKKFHVTKLALDKISKRFPFVRLNYVC